MSSVPIHSYHSGTWIFYAFLCWYQWWQKRQHLVSAVHLSWFSTVHHQWSHQLLFLLHTLQLFSLCCGLQKCIFYSSHIAQPFFLPLCVKEFIPERNDICCASNLVPQKFQDYLVRKVFEFSEFEKKKVREKKKNHKRDLERQLQGFCLVLLP